MKATKVLISSTESPYSSQKLIDELLMLGSRESFLDEVGNFGSPFFVSPSVHMREDVRGDSVELVVCHGVTPNREGLKR